MNEYVLVNQKGKLFAGYTDSGRRKHTADIKEAIIEDYESLLSFSKMAYFEYQTVYKVIHISEIKDWSEVFA